MSLFRGRASRILALVLCAAWVATVACADAHGTPGMHRHHMPCCPQDSAGTQCCSAAQCGVQAPRKTEARSDGPVVNLLVADAVFSDLPLAPRAGVLWELTRGLRFAAAVFLLKDDLRI